jgi:hypothetical protein
MATIDCRWDVPTPVNWEDWDDWSEAKRLAAQLPADWKVNCALGGLAPVVIQDGDGNEVGRLSAIEFNRWDHLARFLREVVPELLKQLTA